MSPLLNQQTVTLALVSCISTVIIQRFSFIPLAVRRLCVHYEMSIDVSEVRTVNIFSLHFSLPTRTMLSEDTGHGS